MTTPIDQKAAIVQSKLELAETMLRRSQYPECRKWAAEVLQDDPHHERALELTGYSCLLEGLPDEALRTAKELRRAHPNAAAAHHLIGHVDQAQGSDPFQTEGHFRSAIRLDPQDAGLRASLALFVGGRGRLEEGITIAQQGLRIDPQDSRVLHALQALYRLNNEAELAAKFAAVALEVDPDDADHHFELALLHLSQGRDREGRRGLLEALRLEPADTNAVDLMAHEIVLRNRLFRGRWLAPTDAKLAAALIAAPLFWWGLAWLLWRPLRWVAWLALVVLMLAYAHRGLFWLYSRVVRRRIQRGRL